MAKRAQSVTEFLTTYGFVIFIIAIAIALLFLFTRTAGSVLPTSCSIYGTLGCSDVVYGANAMTGMATLVVRASDQQRGTINVSGFSADVGGSINTGGYCSTDGAQNGPTAFSQGQIIYCVATFPTNAVPAQAYSGTFNITGSFCPGAASSCPSSGTKYFFGGSFRTQGTANVIISTTSIPQTYTPTLPYAYINYIYIANEGSSTIDIVDTATNGVVGMITSGIDNPADMRFAPSGTYAYVSNWGSSDNVVIVSTATNTVVGSVIGTFSRPNSVEFAPSGGYAYITDYGSSRVDIVSTATNAVVGQVTGSFDVPGAVAFAPSGGYAYVANFGSSNVVIVSTATNAVVGLVTGEFNEPLAIEFAPSGDYAYVSNIGTDSVDIVSTESNSIVGSIQGGFDEPFDIEFAPSGDYAYISNSGSSNIVIVDTSMKAVVGSITGSWIDDPSSVAIAP